MGEMEQMKQEAEQLKKQIAVMLATVMKLLRACLLPTVCPNFPPQRQDGVGLSPSTYLEPSAALHSPLNANGGLPAMVGGRAVGEGREEGTGVPRV